MYDYNKPADRYTGRHAKHHAIRQWVIRHNIRIFIAIVAIASLVITWQSAWGQITAAPVDIVVKSASPAVAVPSGLSNPALEKSVRAADASRLTALADAKTAAHLSLLHREHLEHLARLRAQALAAKAAAQASRLVSAPVTTSITSAAQAAPAAQATGSGAAGTALAWALTQEGKSYVWGGTGPDGYDCSGLVMVAYEHAGVQLPRTTEDMLASGMLTPTSNPRPGDLAFYGSGHVELYASPGKTFGAHDSGSLIGYIDEWEVPAYYRVG